MSFLDWQHKIKSKTPSAHKEKRRRRTCQHSVENGASKHSENKKGPTPNEPSSKNYEIMGDILTTPVVQDINDDTFQL